MSERRRYRAEMPEAAWPNGRPPRARTTKRRAYDDLAFGLERYLRPHDQQIRLADPWAAWALRMATQRYAPAAPDGSRWFVRTIVEYV